MTLNPKIRGFSGFFAILGCDTQFKSELHRNGFRDQDNLHMKISGLNVDFSSPSPDALIQGGLRTRVSKRGTPLKSGYLSAVGSSIVKTVADIHRHVAYHNKHQWRSF